jgi:hypothetical protein
MEPWLPRHLLLRIADLNAANSLPGCCAAAPNRTRVSPWRTSAPSWPGSAPRWRCWRAASVEAFTTELFITEVRKTVAILLLVLAMVIGAGAFFRWLNVERAMRHKTPLPLPLIAPILAVGGAVVAAILVVFVVLRPL